MKIDILSLFPHMFDPMKESILGKAIEKNIIDLNIVDFRKYSVDKHHNVDDYIFGGGAGMLLQPQPILDAYQEIQNQNEQSNIPKGKVILMDPAGKKFNQHSAEKLSKEKHLTFICGHYEGYDERIKSIVTDEYSIGDFILTGGELPAMTMIDSISRMIPRVLGNKHSAPSDSFSSGLLEAPEYTRPANFRGMRVPPVLLSGDHKKIKLWRQKEALRKTYLRRPDLIHRDQLSDTQKKLFLDVRIEEDQNR
ncbi:tRNA (guanine-N(1)-)-methyltransferase [Philodulcilactobacillus myokoensis]|uniref:tRNA (guanine-N(1)-)-methyltransferase n=1 Tax=Philodulcilactobacillus myokoensis TaxID=2929573 RepID=A0A9W6B0R9_9LACO|nr:tRNA (guanosine(37)-N1)-methyltransferase TrmD [Philodulcilactobacillus myokoensis]GLB46832.1 tRNA (guanine-N(1)-)-methyltransferase [Philodulcilactobacillus myokoensis]